jgi:hypothetical protein
LLGIHSSEIVIHVLHHFRHQLREMQPAELERQREELAAQRVAVDKLLKAAEKVKEEGRDQKIRLVVAGHKSAGARRGIEHGMKSLNLLDDMNELWVDLAEAAEAGGQMVATRHNLVEVNLAIDKQAEIFVKMKELARHELAMQVVASKSPLAWKTVKRMEGAGEFDKEQLGIGEKEVRGAEKELMQYEKEIAAAVGGARKFVPRGPGGTGPRGGREGDGEGSYPRGAPGDRTGGYPRGALGDGAGPPYAAAGRGGGAAGGVKCYDCGGFGHMSYNCPSQRKEGGGRSPYKRRKN